jgi:hypothetical protein
VSVALVIQHAKRMRRHIILSPVAYQDPPYFSALSHKGTIFEKKKLFNPNVCFDFPYNFVCNISRPDKN